MTRCLALIVLLLALAGSVRADDFEPVAAIRAAALAAAGTTRIGGQRSTSCTLNTLTPKT